MLKKKKNKKTIKGNSLYHRDVGVKFCDPVVIKCSRLYNCFHMTNLWVYFQKEINRNHNPKCGALVVIYVSFYCFENT